MNIKKTTRNFKGMSYREVQGTNSKNRSRLQKEDRQWLKENGHRNIGWDGIINLYQKIEKFLGRDQWKDFSLEELFLEADCIGNKYLSSQEIANFNQRLSQEVNEVAEEIARQFPDTENEFIDFSDNTNKNSPKHMPKRYLKLVRSFHERI